MPHTSVVSNSVWPLRWQPTRLLCPRILQARTLEWVSISFSNAWKWKVKGMSLSPVHLFGTARTAAYQTPPSMWFSRQEYWSAVSSTSYIYIYAAKSLQSCPTLCDPVDDSPPGSSVPGILQERILERIAISFTISKIRQRRIILSFWEYHMCLSRSVMSNSVNPWTVACQAPLSMNFSKQEY